ncbi:tetratricopeptide repeat protein [Persephonella atlantica]|uniref:Tetratricopeptide repeat protein n=2 Tax=Persephonella atlantica TaxID=2699429 RepID=A0ABS1GK28_9AQUI|nr:tetratricopeptide repeat protein [Persephonella atlantica]
MAVLTILLLINGSYALEYQEIKKSYYRSYQYEKTGDYENAIKALMFVYNEYPDGYTVNLRLGWLYYLMKRYANSVFHYKKAIKAAPYSVEAKLGYTLPLLAQKKFSEVESICYQIINTDFYNYYGNLRLSYALRMEKKYETAVKIAQKMLALYPTDINFLMELALSKFSLGKKEEAKKIFLDVLILDPENITAREYLKY